MQRKWFWICIGLGILTVFANFALFSLIPVPLKISPDTTFVTEPKTSDGKFINYFRALELLIYPPEMATDDNGYRLVVQKLGVGSEYKSDPVAHQEYCEQICEKLGLDPNALDPPLPFDCCDNMFHSYIRKTYPDSIVKGTDRYTAILRGQRTDEETTMLADWVATHTPALDVLVEATAKPVFRIPYYRSKQTPETEYLASILLPTVQESRNWARGLRARAEYRLTTGDLDGAYTDIITTQRLGRGVSHGLIIEKLIGIALESIAMAIPLTTAEHQPTESQIAQLQQALQQLAPVGDVATSMMTERYGMLSAGQMFVTSKYLDLAMMTGNPSPAATRLFGRIPVNVNEFMKRMNKHFTDCENGKFDTSILSNTQLFAPGSIAMTVLSRNARSQWMGDLLTSLMLPAMDAVQEADNRYECLLRMKRITLAMVRYHARHGVFPPSRSEHHSWRVLLLPYFDEPELTSLSEKIRLDEPWDSEHNAQFLDQCPTVYRCRSAEKRGLPASKTTYTVFVGDVGDVGDVGIGVDVGDSALPTLFDGTTVGRKPDDTKMNQILFGERLQPVDWMIPNQEISASDSLDFCKQQPGPRPSGQQCGSHHSGGANFSCRAGNVLFLSVTTQPERFEELLTGTATWE